MNFSYIHISEFVQCIKFLYTAEYISFQSTKKNFTNDNTEDDVIELSDKLYNLKNKPDKSTITIQIGKPTINTKKAFYDDNRPIEYGVHSKGE